MKIVKITDFTSQINKNQKFICILGFFDGWHQGHQLLLTVLKEIAKKNNLIPLVISFDIKPQKFLKSEVSSVLLSSDEKINFLKLKQITNYWEIKALPATLNTEPKDFIKWLLLNNIEAIVTTSDITFGHMGKGDIAMLQVSPIKVYLVDSYFLNQEVKISSTLIKKLIRDKNLELANQLLKWRPYTVTGVVIDGIKEGRLLGYPTANLCLITNYLTPTPGIYFSNTIVDNKSYQSVTFVSKRNKKDLIETYLLDFHQDLYGKTISVAFLKFWRDSWHFSNQKDLIDQIKIDIKAAEAYFKNS